MSRRIEQVNRLIQKNLSEIIARDLELPAGVLLTITRVKTGSDLKSAKIYVSVLPAQQSEAVLSFLGRRKNFLQHKLAGGLTMKFSPKIYFAIDATEAEAGKIEEILDSLQLVE